MARQNKTRTQIGDPSPILIFRCLNCTDKAKTSQEIYPKIRPLASSTTYKNYIIARKRFGLIETAESRKQLPQLCPR